MPAWLALLAACTHPAPPPPQGGPSILWVSLDTVRADHLSVYGGPAATPTLDALAREAVVYEQAYSHFPETGLSHWSMMTGVLPEVHGNVPAAADSAWTGPTAAEIARARGYRTGAFVGGVTLTSEATGLDRGFDLYDDSFPTNPRDMKRDGAEVVRRALAWQGAQRGPSFTFVHLFDAHFPYTPRDPRRYDAGYTGSIDGTDATLAGHRDWGTPLPAQDLAHLKALYDAELTELDAALAPLLAAQGKDVVIVVTGDHGESFEHGYLANHRGSLADGTLHVPLLVRAPGLAPARVPDLVGLTDVLPTVADLAGWTLDVPVNGHSVRPGAAGPARTEVWSRTDPWETRGVPDGPLLAVRTSAWKVIWGASRVQAWDLRVDPGENLTVDAPTDLADARARYTELLEAMADHREARAPRRVAGGENAPMLEALGYVAPPDPAPGGPLGRPDPSHPPGVGNRPGSPKDGNAAVEPTPGEALRRGREPPPPPDREGLASPR